MSVTDAPKPSVVGTGSQRISECLAAIDGTLQTARKRGRADESEPIEIREKNLREQLHVLTEFVVSFGPQLIPVAERIARTIVSSVVSKQVAVNESWETAAVFCAYFPSAGAVILTELFEQFIQSGSIWMPALLGVRYNTVSPRLDSIADMIAASIGYVEASLAQRFATLFAIESSDIAIYRRSQLLGGQSLLVMPHSVNNVFTALLLGLRPCPPSVLAECNDRMTGVRGHSYSPHSVYPKPQLAANKAPTLAAADSVQLSTMPLPFLGAYKLAQESVVRLRAALAQVLHPRSQPFYQPPTSSAVDVWPSTQMPTPHIVSEKVVARPESLVTLPKEVTAAAQVPTHPALSDVPLQLKHTPANKKAVSPKRTPKQKPMPSEVSVNEVSDLPDIEF
eukprot:GILI01016832.1.p1 GENE.GILI01016832.1~~GILI01016832.1.p1  ORF type:complete len:394 (-),score=38.11 GILI01016832.1:82-1263(-)